MKLSRISCAVFAAVLLLGAGLPACSGGGKGSDPGGTVDTGESSDDTGGADTGPTGDTGQTADDSGNGGDAGADDSWTGWYEIQSRKATEPFYSADDQSYLPKQDWCSNLSKDNVSTPKSYLKIEKANRKYYVSACPEQEATRDCNGLGRYEASSDTTTLTLAALQYTGNGDYQNYECLCETTFKTVERTDSEVRFKSVRRGHTTDQSCSMCPNSRGDYEDDECMVKKTIAATPIE
ncbi:MAG: hypothetical protein ABEN55_19900 [Bradymonadaceae bacterium]